MLFFAVLLTQQRGAYISAIFASLYYLSNNKINFKYLLLFVSIISVGGIYIFSTSINDEESYLYYTANRVTTDVINSNPYSERAISYQKGLMYLSEFPFGMGIGATTSAADNGGAHPGGQVVDANYMRILSDLGIVGLYVFIAVLVFATRSIFVRQRPKAFLVILLIYSFQATGTNVFDSYYVTHLYWLFLGIIDTPNKKV